MKNKKVLIGFIAAFIISLNIYNIPFKKESVAATSNPQPKNNESEFNIEKFQTTLNQYLKETKNLYDFDYVIVTFWATWCGSCHKENGIINNFLKKNSRILFIGLCVDKDTNALANYLKKHPLQFLSLNVTKELAVFFDDIFAVPTHYIINVNRKTKYKTMGILDETELNNILRSSK